MDPDWCYVINMDKVILGDCACLAALQWFGEVGPEKCCWVRYDDLEVLEGKKVVSCPEITGF